MKNTTTTMNVIHEVADFDIWHRAYMQHTAHRAENRIGILRNIENGNMLWVGEKTDGHESAKLLLASDELKETMLAAGVISKPEIHLMDMAHFEPNKESLQLHVTAIHTVADFDKWKVAFDADEESRQSIGMQLLGLGTGAGNANEVMAIFACKNIEAVKAKFSDPSMQETMKNAGVTSVPSIQYWIMA